MKGILLHIILSYVYIAYSLVSPWIFFEGIRSKQWYAFTQFVIVVGGIYTWSYTFALQFEYFTADEVTLSWLEWFN